MTIGALGTLTFNGMGGTMLRRVRRDPADAPLLLWGTVLPGLATLSRVTAAFAPAHTVVLLIEAAACWTSAFLMLSWLIVRSFMTRTR